jgi:molecular chaperone GrpE (heat shock protein)
MSADDKAAAAWDDYVSQQQQEKIEELERQLNAANDRIKRLEEFVDQLTNPKFTRDDLPKEALLQYIKRLEESGDALKAAGYFGGWADAVNKWIKAKEDKL